MAAVNAAIGKGSTVAIFGAGPVGLMAAASARLLGAERIFMVDHHQYRRRSRLRDLREEAAGLPQGRAHRQLKLAIDSMKSVLVPTADKAGSSFVG
jgi:threonine dehydrogenase-like Zn-dependent dehydrogenase